MSHLSRSRRRLATVPTSMALAALVASGTVLAGTPITNGYRDHAYSGGATRPAGDKPQSKLWYTDEGSGNVQWWGSMYYPGTTSLPKSEFRIFKLSPDKSTWSVTTTVLDDRDSSHGDYLWDEVANTLFVATVPNPNTSEPFALPANPDGIRIYKATYDSATDTYTKVGGFPVTIQNTASTASPEFRGGSWTVSIDRDSTGRLWVAWPKLNQVLFSYSDDGGAIWSDPAQVPGSNTINSGTLSTSDSATVIAYGNGAKDTVGIMWSDQDNLPAPADNGYFLATIAAGAEPTVGGNWSLDALPAIAGTTTDDADNHINIKSTSGGDLYMVGKARTDTINCATNKQRPLIPFYAKPDGGSWSAHLAGTVGDCNTRPQVLISEQLDVAYLLMTSPNGGGAIYMKSAPLSGSEAFEFRGAADQTVQRGTPFIRASTTDLVRIDDPSSTKQVVTDASGIVAIGNNLPQSNTPNVKIYVHNHMAIPASDTTDPTGTVTINGGAAVTSNVLVSVAVPGSDPGGSGVSLVRLSNSSSVDGSGVLNGAGSTSFTYDTPISWSLPSGDGDKTVYAQWRDAKGRWSAVANDTINLNTTDTVAPTTPGIPTHRLFGSGRFGIPVRIEWTGSTDNLGVQHYDLQRSVNGGAFATVGTPTVPAMSIDLPNSTVTYRFRVRAFDGVNYSAFRTGPTFKATSYSESRSALRYTGTWGNSTSTAYVGGKAKVSTVRNSTVSLTFVGKHIGWLSRMQPTAGSARVYIDGTLVKTVSLYSATTVDRKLAYVKTFSTAGTHTIRIVVLGTSGHPRVTLDQLFVLG